jgi:hypothetical protein
MANTIQSDGIPNGLYGEIGAAHGLIGASALPSALREQRLNSHGCKTFMPDTYSFIERGLGPRSLP